MKRRTVLAGLPAIGAAMALPATAGGDGSNQHKQRVSEKPKAPSPPLDGRVDRIVAQLVDAIAAETAVYRSAGPESGPADDVADAATGAAYQAGRRLLDVPRSEGMACVDYVPALALIHRRWLIMEGSYAEPVDRDVCALVDAVLAGHRFDRLPMLWHVDGEPRLERPSDAEFRARWDVLRSR